MLILLLACTSGDKESGTTSDTGVTSGTPATLTEIQADIFGKSCAFSSCHGDGGNAGSLKLNDGESYGELVNQPATVTGEILVIPGDPDGSYLVKKLENADPSQVMPPGSPLPDANIARVRSWIADGAQDN